MKIASLNLKTGYSFYKSIIRIDEFCRLIKEYGYEACGINDDEIYGYFEFEKECKKNNLKPIYLKSIKFKINNPNKNLDCSLYIKNEEGYKSILKIYEDKIDTFNIDNISLYSKGLGFILNTDSDFAFDDYQKLIAPTILKLKKIFLDDFYFGITISSKEDEVDSKTIYKYIDDNEYKLIPFPVIRYHKKSEGGLYEIFSSASKDNVNNLGEEINYSLDKQGSSFILKYDVFKSIYREKDLLNLDKLVSNINFELVKKRGDIITFDNDIQTLKEKTYSSLEKLKKNEDKIYLERLDYELSVISKMGFASYFLLVSDYVEYAKNHDIKVGFGRGSAVGSLVSYLLKITSLDPIIFNLSFERFLNPKRQSMPDIDLDFEDSKREEVISYLKRKYSEDKVAKIITFSKLRPRSAINLLGKALKISDNKLKAITSSISANCKTFTDAKNDKYYSKKFMTYYNDPLYKKLIDNASLLLSLPIQTSIHASGVIISKDPIYKEVPMSLSKSGIVLFEYSYLEEIGFLKFDILSLSNLSFLRNIENNLNFKFDELSLLNNLNDIKVYDELNSLNLVDIFQLDEDNSSIKEAIKEIKPTSFDDLASLLALYRPGAMNYISLYSRRKNEGEKITYLHPKLENILKSTYGIMIYQEQVMEVVKEIANFSLAEADIFRRAIAKKRTDLMNEYKVRFIKQASENKIDKKTSELIFEDILKFASYGFNKSHAYAYGFLTYVFLYLKTYYPLAFYNASYNKNQFFSAKGQKLYLELKRKYKNIKIDINISLLDGLIYQNDTLYLPLNTISKVDTDILNKLIEYRNESPFESYKDIFIRLSSYIYDHNEESKKIKASEMTLLSLIDAGVFDLFKLNRETMKNNVTTFLKSASFKDILDRQEVILSKENVGLKLYLEKEKLGVVISSSLIKSNNDRFLFVIDIIKFKDRIKVILSDGIKEYNLFVSNMKVERYAFFHIKTNFDRTTLFSDNLEYIKYLNQEIKDEKDTHN